MKVYKVYFNNEPNTWKYLSAGYVCFPSYKREEYKKRYEFNKLFKNAFSGENPRVNTFNSSEICNSLFFFLDLFDAVKYTMYHKSKYGSFNNETLDYKILELDLPDELVLKYLGVGNYVYERECDCNFSLEIAIPFDEIKKLGFCSISDSDTLKLDNVNIYSKDDISIVRILEYLSFNPNFKTENYKRIIESILNILGFQIALGAMYEKSMTGKLKFIQDTPQYKMALLSRLLPDIKKEIEENLNKVWEGDIRKI